MCFSTAGIREKFTIPLGRRNTKSRDIPSRHIPRDKKKGSVKRSLLGFLGPSSFFFFRFLRFSFSLVHGDHRFVHSERICFGRRFFFYFPSKIRFLLTKTGRLIGKYQLNLDPIQQYLILLLC